MNFIRTTKPTKNDKYYVRQASGGYSTCIKGKPTDKECDVLANCVGFACGFFNEFIGLGYEKYHLNCNAENFIERAIAMGLSVVKNPVPGGIMVWQKGPTLSGSDGAGHVAGCTWVNNLDNPTEVKTSDSGYGSSAFWRTTRKKGNGNWGAGTNYTYRGCIVPPNYVKPVVPTPTSEPTPTPEPTPEPVKQDFEVGDKVVVTGYATGDSFGGGAKTAKYTGSLDEPRYITKITDLSRPRPYHISVGNKLGDGDRGWVSKEQIKKI